MAGGRFFCAARVRGIVVGTAAALVAAFWSDGAIAADAPRGKESAELRRFEFHEKHMAVDFGVILYAPDDATARRAADAAFARVREVDEHMSDYSPISELNKLADTAPTETAVPLSDDLFRVLTRAKEYSALSDGAFDCTVGAVVKQWRRARRTLEIPDPAALQKSHATVGYKSLEIDPKTKTARLLKPGTRLDLGAIAKGYGSDVGLAAMKKLGVTHALVSGSGDIAVGDPPPGKTGWRIDIASLDLVSEPTRHAIVANCGISTSGDSIQHVKIGGKQFSHVVDPRTGMALTDHCSVTVIAHDCTASDSLSTAVSVLGPEKGIAMIEKLPDAAALVVHQPAEKVETHESTRFGRYLEK